MSQKAFISTHFSFINHIVPISCLYIPFLSEIVIQCGNVYSWCITQLIIQTDLSILLFWAFISMTWVCLCGASLRAASQSSNCFLSCVVGFELMVEAPDWSVALLERNLHCGECWKCLSAAHVEVMKHNSTLFVFLSIKTSCLQNSF